jgi:tetratricopeptide (TPR) repeat protein
VNALISGGSRGLQALNQVLTSLNQLDALANEAMRDIDESLETFNFLLEQNELKSATERLMEAFAIGEYMPSVRVLPREKKRKVVEFSRNGNNLLSAIEVRDYDKAEALLGEIQKVAKDFDSAKAMTLIQTAKAQSNMHLAKARNASMSGEKGGFENELKEAATIWPMNPDLKKVATKIFDQGDVQQQAIIDFERYLSQKNYRQIYEDQVRFIAATATYPAKQKELKKVLENMLHVESGIQRAQELSKRGDHAGAWESVEKTFHDYPGDPVLNQERARYTTEASDFVKNLRRASELEEKGQIGASLAWYLKAQKIYPPSEFAGDAIIRLAKKIIPESTGS